MSSSIVFHNLEALMARERVSSINLWRSTMWSPRETAQIQCNYRVLALKYAGRGQILSIGQEIACHFSHDHTMVTKLLDFIKKHPKYKVVKSFFYYLDRCSRNSAETEPRSWFFGIENHKINFSFNFFTTKSQNFISNLNDNCSQLSFEVYNVCVTQKLQISEFLIELFFHLEPGLFGDLPRPQFQPHWPQPGIKYYLKMSAFIQNTFCFFIMKLEFAWICLSATNLSQLHTN